MLRNTHIIDFWRGRPDLWITPPHKQTEADELIYRKFWGFSWGDENLIGRIIYLDQFSRHFQRYGVIDEAVVSRMREEAVDMVHLNLTELAAMDEIEIVFALMPFKHTGRYNFIFEYLHGTWLQREGQRVVDLPHLSRFYMDTYKKAFTLQDVKLGLINIHHGGEYDAGSICDYYPAEYLEVDWAGGGGKYIGKELVRPLLNKRLFVSLSGGVDSMVMLRLLKMAGACVEAIHIVYGNRAESEHEYRFLTEFCAKLGVRLWVYRIKWLRRGEVDRQFYEDMTRELRFMTYRACGELVGSQLAPYGHLCSKNEPYGQLGSENEPYGHLCSKNEPYVLLGHIRDDIVENIWTNIVNCTHLGNLKKMEAEEVQMGVRILRPFLETEKSFIYRLSTEYAVPYLKNTTPSWSNRGKFREQFHAATVAQFGGCVDSRMIKFAEAIQNQASLINMLLYKPIYDSFNNNIVNITTAVRARLDANEWMQIFEHICHVLLKRPKPSIKAVRDFRERLYRHWEKLNVEMGKGIVVHVRWNGVCDVYTMEFILAEV